MLGSYNVKLAYKVGPNEIIENHWVTTRNKVEVLEAAKNVIMNKFGLTHSDIEERYSN